MTILETFIKLRDDLKLWVTNNLNQKANISYVDEKFAAVPEFDPSDLIGEIDTTNARVDEVEADFSNYKTEVSEQFTEFDTTINNHIANMDNPHGVTKGKIGLANVDNTADIDKPISNATQAALDEKANTEHTHDADDITDGVLSVGCGGTGYYTILDNTYTTPRYRASALMSTETVPYHNGIINWVYE